MTPQDEMEEDRPMGLLDQLLSRMVDIWNSKEMGVRTGDNGEMLCYYCGEPVERRITHKDHVFARAKGGDDSLRNFVLSCDSCNMSKGAKHPLEWIENRNIPDDLAIDYIARLLIGVYFSYRRQPASLKGKIRGWQRYRAEHRNIYLLPDKTYHLRLPSYPFNEIVEVNDPCCKCGCTGMKAELPAGLLIMLRCSVCSNAELLHAYPNE